MAKTSLADWYRRLNPIQTHPVPPPKPDHRAGLAVLMDGTVRNEAGWHYQMTRKLRYPTLEQALHGSVLSDCSFGCGILCRLEGLDSPIGPDWQGNSWTMWQTLKTISRAQVMVGDMITLGHEGRLHAMIVRNPTDDMTCWSHGQEGGPKYVPLSAEVSYHASRYSDGGVVTFLRMPG